MCSSLFALSTAALAATQVIAKLFSYKDIADSLPPDEADFGFNQSSPTTTSTGHGIRSYTRAWTEFVKASSDSYALPRAPLAAVQRMHTPW